MDQIFMLNAEGVTILMGVVFIVGLVLGIAIGNMIRRKD